MKLILLSGGSGKRLWPLSNDARSKQFLRILQGPGDRKESMVERVWRQLGEAGLQQNAYIATGAAQEELLRSHVGQDVPIIIEPERRDTFPAIALAAVYLYSVAGMRLDEAVAILPVDPYVETSFFSKVHELEQVLQHSAAELALIGVKRPTLRKNTAISYLLLHLMSWTASGQRRRTVMSAALQRSRIPLRQRL